MVRSAPKGAATGRLVEGKATADDDVLDQGFDRPAHSIGHRSAAQRGRLGGITMTEQYVLDLKEIDESRFAVVGGKGAQLGSLSRIEGIRVPAGFCVTTDAYRRVVARSPSLDAQLDRLSRVAPDDQEAIRVLSAEIRRTIEGIAVPDDLAEAITRALARSGEQVPHAVRSSATAEDLPTASFAGQQDTYLNVMGPEAVLRHVSRCWASLFTERAVTYRRRGGIDDRTVLMGVVVQRMVSPHARASSSRPTP